MIAAIQSVEALKILSGHVEAISRRLTIVELWDGRMRQVDVAGLREQVDCPTCKRHEFPWLAGKGGGRTAILCGRNAVQLTHPGGRVSLAELAPRLRGMGRLTENPYFLRLAVDSYELTLFADGRTIVSGTSDPATARSLYAKYIGG